MHDTNHQSRITNHAGHEIRENTMTTHNDQAKTFFPLSLDGRGVRGEGGVLRYAIIVLATLFLAAPNAALADNECVPVGVDPSANLGLSDSYDCDESSNSNDYPDGVTYTADGDLTVSFTGGGVSEVLDAGVDLGGINLSATDTDSIFFDSLTTEIESDSVTGALLNVTTVNGNIDIDTGQMDADGQTPQGVTHAIFAESTGSGNINIATTGSVSVASNNNPDNAIGIEARSNGGDIDIVTGGGVSGIQYGILAGTSGSGALILTVNGDVSLPSQGSARESSVAVVDVTSGTGLLTVNVAGTSEIRSTGGGSSNFNIDGGIGIRADAGGDQVINVASGGLVFISGNTTMDLTAAGTITVNNAGRIVNNTNTSGSTLQSVGNLGEIEEHQVIAIRAAGDALTLNNDNEIRGVLDFSGLTEGYVFNNNAGAEWVVRSPPDVTDGVSPMGAGTLNNAGTIDFTTGNITARTPGSVVSAPGTDFTGTGDSLLEMVVFLDGTGQVSCADASVAKAADCLDLSGGSTAGQTTILPELQFTTLVDGPLGQLTSANSGIVLVDVNGGTSQADHFVLDPDTFLRVDPVEPGGGDAFNMPVYAEDPIYGAVLDIGGMFDYSLLYNPDTQQHVLASVPQRQAIEYVAYIDEATSLWHTTSDAVAGRQAEVRDGATGKLWARVVSESSERDATPTHTSHGNSFEYEHGYSLDSDALIIGSDLAAGDDHVLGLHVGAVRSRLDFDDSDTRDKSKGAVFGAYGGWWNESGLSLDATLNGNFVKLDHNVTGFENSEVSYISLGARVEAGWRLPLMDETLYVQPLATAAYVTTDFEDLELRDNTLGFEDATSLRGALGARLGGEMDLNRSGIAKLGYWLTARAWEESSDEGEVRFKTRDGGYLAIADDRGGSFEEVNFGVSASNADDTLSGYLSGGFISGDEADSHSISIGARLNW